MPGSESRCRASPSVCVDATATESGEPWLEKKPGTGDTRPLRCLHHPRVLKGTGIGSGATALRTPTPWLTLGLLIRKMGFLTPACLSHKAAKQDLCGPNFYHNASSGSCCYQCPSDQVPRRPCPQRLEDCRKKCKPEYYLEDEWKPQCLLCVRCSSDDLVETTPCSWNSPRVCECQEGMFCVTEVRYTCARCQEHTPCNSGTRVKNQGTSKKDTVCENCPPGTFSNHNFGTKDCRPHTSCPKGIIQKGNATHDNVCFDLDPSSSTTTADPFNWSSTNDPGTFSPSFTGRPNPGSESLLWVATVFAVTFGFVLFLICQQRACRKGILQKLHLYPVQVFQSKTTTIGHSPRKNCQQPTNLPGNAKISEIQVLMGNHSAPETNNHKTSSSREAIGLDLKATENLDPGDIAEPRAATEHTNNQIENIYIMKADTVILGSVLRVSEGKNPTPMLELEEEALETNQSTHYPEQETELSPGGHIEIMFSVEEEGKEYHWPTAVSTK
ncbi:tumor necrosis factor receptor superfamily member 8 [Macrotis lagotis]|uniref:tumor necrosis factor receptor superfamily member 8 n=1 Tax=Macrotis lagotis TaxID=92651 RepID=UPI003D68CCEE